jgi:hypothetical protein
LVVRSENRLNIRQFPEFFNPKISSPNMMWNMVILLYVVKADDQNYNDWINSSNSERYYGIANIGAA